MEAKIRYNEGMTSEASKTQDLTEAKVQDKTLRHLLTTTTTILVLAGLGLLIQYFYSLVVLLGIVLIITYLLLGPVNLMERGIIAFSNFTHRIPHYKAITSRSPEANPRMLAVFIVYFVFFMTLTVGSIQFLPHVTRQLGELSGKLGTQAVEATDKLIDWADRTVGQGALRNFFAKDIQQAERQGIVKQHSSQGKPVTEEEKEVIQQTVLQSTVNQMENALASALPNFISLVAGTLNGFVYFMAGLLLTFYFLVDGHKLKKEFIRFVPRRMQNTAETLLGSFHQVMFSFIKGQVMLGALTGFYMFIVYSIFHVPYALLLGLIFALAELLPVVGTWIGITIGLVVILTNMPPITALWVWLFSYGYQTIKDNILAPKVVGDVMGLHPLVIILALLVCAQAAGLLGVLLALPLASAVNVIVRMLLNKDAQEKNAQKASALSPEAGHA
ncbi:MAG TPA: AI-2E family transporter [Coleofasciculaceae cyanobacterium]